MGVLLLVYFPIFLKQYLIQRKTFFKKTKKKKKIFLKKKKKKKKKKGLITITDDDKIERSNLSRQFLFRNWNVGDNKVFFFLDSFPF